MTHIVKKTLFLLLLAVSAAGCADPYYRPHAWGNYNPGYYGSYSRGGYAPYSAPYEGRSWRDWGEHHHHHDDDHDGD
jgi:hypothetical protein